MKRLGKFFAFAAALLISVSFFALPSCTSSSAVNNTVLVPQFTLDVAKAMGPKGHMTLNLKGISAAEGVDNVQVFLRCSVPQPGTEESFQALNRVDEIIIQSKAGAIKDMVFDVTGAMKSMLDYNPAYVRGMEVVFIVTPKNRSIVLDDNSFVVKETSFSVYGADGKPVALQLKPKA